MSGLCHILPPAISGSAPERMSSPFIASPHPWARAAAEEVIREVHHYMQLHPESELHRLGKMFGVLVMDTGKQTYRYLKAFSSVLDGQHQIDGYVPPIYDFTDENGYFRQEEKVISSLTDQNPLRKQRSNALQRWLFSQYNIVASNGKTRNILDIFSKEKPILSAEDYFSGNKGSKDNKESNAEHLPPAGAGECCAPKLLQYAFQNGYKPLAIAEFWVGATDAREMHQDGCFYGACTGKCRPILRYMLRGISAEETEDTWTEEQLKKQVHVLYEDEYLLVALKPAGLLTVPGKGEKKNLEGYLLQSRGYSYLKAVHRLDQDTSGIVVFAKEVSHYTALQKQFCSRLVKKRYEALVCPRDEHRKTEETGIISLPILPNPTDRPRQMVDRKYGKKAVTQYEVVRRLQNGQICLNLYPLTGRTHQLRVHCSHPEGLNAPIAGDRLYGEPSGRLYLHAAEIVFSHPVSGSTMRFHVRANWL